MTHRGTLPALRAPYDTTDEPEYGNNRYRRSPQSQDQNQIVPFGQNSGGQTQRDYHSRGPSRLDLLEERLAQQERSTATVMDRAFKIKEDVIDSLNFTHGTWQDEKHARSMLQEHIRTITAIVNKLNNDIASLDDQLRVRDNAAVGTNSAVKNLEVHHVASLTDLRGRIVRCDTSIAKLSSELRNCTDSLKQIGGTQQDNQNRLLDRIHNLESKIVQVNNLLDRSSSEQKMKLQHLEGDTGQQMSILDSKTRSIMDDMKNMINQFQAHQEGEREKLESRLFGHIEKISAAKDTLIEKLERKMDENHYVTDARLQKVEEAVMEERARISELQHDIENKLMAKLDFSIRNQQEEFSKLKREVREGFATVHESISNMKTVMEGKRKILEDQLRKEISQIRKMVVLV
ncbi:protein FAM81A-like [Mytilus californianus]|uniref:protein FAM81A-like n=1 Tax=Mytilus californianus TaxID=6549 RepID=UPI0022477525|nr:protein FAM81A-like [Mytilus californianus]XP_052098448.1 protein FAM81A-like [Mytilus californianus]XP_052098449.1 protein FAM81A-like [Mytilus californianus]